MKLKELAFAAIVFTIGHTILWYQANAQFFSPWAKNNKLLLACLIGPVVSYLFITGVAWVSEATNGEIWPTRLVPQMIGTIVFTVMTYLVFEEGLNLKNGICFGLSILVILIQIFWK